MRHEIRLAIIAIVTAALATAADASAQSWKTVAKSRRRTGQDLLEVKIEYGVGRFQLKRGPERLLYRLDATYDSEAFDLTSNYIESGGSGVLSIDIEGHDNLDLHEAKDYDWEQGSLRVELSDAVPLSLRAKFGAAKAELDLGGLRLRELTIQTGASETAVRFSEPNPEVAEFCRFKAAAAEFRLEQLGNSGCKSLTLSGGVGAISLDFSGAWRQDASANVNVGLGGIDVRVPAELGVRIERSTFLMAFDAPGFEKREDGVWISRNWETASHHLTLSISGALGEIKVARM